MQFIAPYFVFLGLIIGPIWLIWGQKGSTIPNFVTWWCGFVGLTNESEIQTAIGVFAGAALLCAIYFTWSFVLAMFTALDQPKI